MSTKKPIILLTVLFSTLFLLSACGEDDSSGAGTAMESDAAPAKVFMHDQEVIYQDEIYANWPYN